MIFDFHDAVGESSNFQELGYFRFHYIDSDFQDAKNFFVKVEFIQL